MSSKVPEGGTLVAAFENMTGGKRNHRRLVVPLPLVLTEEARFPRVNCMFSEL